VEIARDPRARVREIAAAAGITERTLAGITADLERDGYLVRSRVGRRNCYVVNVDAPLRHPARQGHRIGPLLELLAAPADIAPGSEGQTPAT
jgi:hypothetical protein